MLQDVCGLIISNCGFYVGRIIPNHIISMYVDFSSIYFGSSLIFAGDAVVGIDYFNIAVPEVIGIAIDETVINAGTGKIFDAISGMDVSLHPVFCDKQVVPAAHNGMVGVIKQVVRIEG